MILPQIDVLNLVLVEILKIGPELLSKYANSTNPIADQLLYLIFIPHVVLMFFGYGIANALFLGSHKGIRNLFMIAAYIFLILSGWYGRIVHIVDTWFVLMLAMGFFVFLVSKLISPTLLSGLAGVGAKAIQAGKGKIANRIEYEKQLEIIDQTLRSVGYNGGAIDPAKYGKAAPEILALVQKRSMIQKELDKL